jgi:FkbM family methyltransferase
MPIIDFVKKITPAKFKNILKGFRSEPPNEELSPYLNYINSLNLGPGDVAMDLGANIGNITAIMASKGATIHAFEPNPYAFQILNQRFAINEKVHCIQKGVLDHPGVLRLYLHENSEADQVLWSTGSSFLEYKGNIKKDKFVEVEVVDLVQFIEELRTDVKLIKMDVEGVECRLLNKLIDSPVFERIEHIIVETHDNKIPVLREETDNLRKKITEQGINKIRLDWI